MFANELDKQIVDEVLSILKLKYEKHKYFNDGVSSRVILLNDKYLIKQNTPLALEAEEEFFKYNKLELFQKIIYVDSMYRYVVYDFIKGSTMDRVSNPTDTINKIINITSSYSPYDKEGFGYYDEKVNS